MKPPRTRRRTAWVFDVESALARWRAEAEDPWKGRIPGHDAWLATHLLLRREIRRRHERSLPFQDELFDRWERARSLGFGKGASIYESAVVLGRVRVGRETWIGPGVVLDGSGGLSIGRWCSISAGVQIYTHDTVAWALTGGKAGTPRNPVRIGDCCYLGPYAIVARGVRVGRRCIVGAHSLVNRDVPAGSFVAGCPARVLGRVEVRGARVRIVRTERG